MKWMITVTLTAALLAGCGARREAAAPPPMPEPTAPALITQSAPLSVAQQMAGKENIITLRMTDHGFAPTTLSVREGSVVRIHLKNESSQAHNFVLERHGIVTSTLPAGGENYVEFTASQKGVWPFASDAPGSVEPGFQGTLKVE
jgi:uncharacterized cupredoxin-like copper-binding protein